MNEKQVVPDESLEHYVHEILATRCKALEERMAELVGEWLFASSEAIRGTIALQHIAHAGSDPSKVKTLDDAKRIATEVLTAETEKWTSDTAEPS